MLRFYHGSFSSSDVDEMEVEEFNQYYNAVRLIESSEILTQLMVSDFPHYKQSKRAEVHSKLKLQMLNGANRVQSRRDIARMLGAINE